MLPGDSRHQTRRYMTIFLAPTNLSLKQQQQKTAKIKKKKENYRRGRYYIPSGHMIPLTATEQHNGDKSFNSSLL